MDKYEIYCSEEQTRKALALGAPIILESEYYTPTENDIKLDSPIPCKSYTCGYHYAKCPTAEQMIGWLEEQGIVSIEIIFSEETKWKFEIFSEIYDYGAPYFSRKEATLAAIDAALNYLTEKK